MYSSSEQDYEAENDDDHFNTGETAEELEYDTEEDFHQAKSEALEVYIEDEVRRTDYLGLARDHVARAVYARNIATHKFDTENIRCCLCSSKERPCTKVLFPCDHLCLCDKCIRAHRIGPWRKNGPKVPTSTWHACPVCMQEIQCIREYRDGEELEEYWEYLHAVKPNLPPGFRKKFKQMAKKLEKDPKLDHTSENCLIQ